MQKGAPLFLIFFFLGGGGKRRRGREDILNRSGLKFLFWKFPIALKTFFFFLSAIFLPSEERRIGNERVGGGAPSPLKSQPSPCVCGTCKPFLSSWYIFQFRPFFCHPLLPPSHFYAPLPPSHPRCAFLTSLTCRCRPRITKKKIPFPHIFLPHCPTPSPSPFPLVLFHGDLTVGGQPSTLLPPSINLSHRGGGRANFFLLSSVLLLQRTVSKNLSPYERVWGQRLMGV